LDNQKPTLYGMDLSIPPKMLSFSDFPQGNMGKVLEQTQLFA